MRYLLPPGKQALASTTGICCSHPLHPFSTGGLFAMAAFSETQESSCIDYFNSERIGFSSVLNASVSD
jgi:hypothetical protein